MLAAAIGNQRRVVRFTGDDDQPYGIVSRLLGAVPAGSYLAISHMVLSGGIGRKG